MKIGILGGTFDPIHSGHLMMAEEARARLSLAEVLFVPAGHPYLKTNRPLSSAEHRLEMVRLAIAGRAGLRLSTVEVDRSGPSYTVDTIAELQAEYSAGTELLFILGWDSLLELPLWWQPARLIQMCQLVAVPRPGLPQPDPKSLEILVPGIARRVIFLDGPVVDISATVIRQRIAQGLSVEHLVPEPVGRYIKRHRLYLVP